MKLRKVLASITASTSLSACCIQDGSWNDESFRISEITDARFEDEVQRCVASDDCEALCVVHWTYFSDQNPEGDSDVRDCRRSGDAVSYEGYATCIAGRRPTRHAMRDIAGSTVGAYFARQALLEAASVRAFADLHADLCAHDAPHALRTAAIRAAADEVRHARLCAALAARYGVQLASAPTPAAARRTLLELAIDNAVEGCVRETYGAIVAAHQARAASDPAVRVVMAAIANDEAMHAQLAWKVHAWLVPRLAETDRARVLAQARAARAALGDLPPPALVCRAGLPDPTTQRALLARLDAEVWARGVTA